MGSAFVSHPPTRHPFGCCLLGLEAHYLDSLRFRGSGSHSLESQTSETSLLFASHLDDRGSGHTQCHRTLLWPPLPGLSSATRSSLWLVHPPPAERSALHP